MRTRVALGLTLVIAVVPTAVALWCLCLPPHWAMKSEPSARQNRGSVALSSGASASGSGMVMHPKKTRPSPEVAALFAHAVPLACRPIQVHARGVVWLTNVWCSLPAVNDDVEQQLAKAPLRADYSYEVTSSAAARNVGRWSWVRKLRVGVAWLTYLAALPNLEELEVTASELDENFSAAVDLAPLAVKGAFPALRTLSLVNAVPVTTAPLRQVATLRSLELENITKTTHRGSSVSWAEIATLTGLTSLSVVYRSDQGVDLDVRTLRGLGLLKRLRLETQGRIRHQESLAAFGSLEELEVVDCSTGGLDAKLLRAWPVLQRLSWRTMGDASIGREIAFALGGPPLLRSATFGSSGCPAREGEGGGNFIDLGGLENGPLRELSVVGFPEVELPARLPKLEALDLSSSVIMTTKRATIVGSFATLQHLSVTLDASMKSLEWLRGLSRLRTLNVRYSAVDDLSPLADLAELEELDVDHSNYVTDLTPLGRLGRLRYADIGNTRVTSLLPLVRAGALEAVNVYGAPVKDGEQFSQARPDVELLPAAP